MTPSERVVGVLLAGGRSRRLGGGDKCLRLLGDKPILARIIDRLRPQVTDMVLNANGEPERFAAFGLPVLHDSVTGFAGPLAGVQAGLTWVKRNYPDVRYAVTVPADTPFFPDDLVRRFLAALRDSPTLLVARSDAGAHPVIGLWPVALASVLEESLRRGERRASTWTKEHGAVEVFFPPVELGAQSIDPFFNINQPEDLATADALLREAMA